MTNSHPSGWFHMGNFIKRDTCQPEEKLRVLMRQRTSWRDSACLEGTYTGNRLAKRLACVCVWKGYTLRSVPPRQLSSWEQYHLSLGATRQWRPDGEQRVEDGTECQPKQRHQIKFCRYSDAKSLWFYCLSEVVSVILYMAIWPFLVFSFCL